MANIDWLAILDWGEGELDDLRFIGFAYIRQGKYDMAATFFEALVTLNAHNPYDFQTLGALYLQKGNNMMALSYLEKALKLDPTHAPTLLNRAKTLFALGYKRQGLQQTQALATHPDPFIADQAAALELAHAP